MEHCTGLADVDVSGCMAITDHLLNDIQRIIMDDRRIIKASEVKLSLGGTCVY